jgi:predicted AAA+ superfamily ATPase
MFSREICSFVERLAQIYPVVCVTGPRQSGKTTLVRQLFATKPYVSLENLDIRREAHTDPRGFLARYTSGAIFDEIQNAPDLLSYLQQMVDEDMTSGRFIITGSQNFALSEAVSQSLAGRVGIATLLPMSCKEVGAYGTWQEAVLKGGYPKVHSMNLSSHEFYPSYIQTYVERDVRELSNIGNFVTFQNFLRLCAGHAGQVINYTSIAQDAGIGVTTAREWLSILEASYVVFRLPTYYKNLNKRRIKMPKLYFYDTGLLAYLLGLQTTELITSYYRSGALFENLVILECLKHQLNRGQVLQSSFWRDYSGLEVDFIIESLGKIKAIEIKSGQTLYPNDIKSLSKFVEMEPGTHMYVVYNGEERGLNAARCLKFPNIDDLMS